MVHLCCTALGVLYRVATPLRFVSMLQGVHEQMHTPALEDSPRCWASACCRSAMSGNRHSRARHQLGNAVKYWYGSSMEARLKCKTPRDFFWPPLVLIPFENVS
jgi:hypothetical protein